MTRKLRACDLFCGAGGTSAGAEATGSVRVDFAVNHWSVAVQTHSANFPNARHVNSRLDQVNPSECGKIDLLFASPECTHHSRARGGRPTSDQQRSGAWDLMRWLEHHRPSWLVVENVREFEQWGPVANGKPLVSGRGKFFESWLSAIKAGGYRVDYRLLNAYGNGGCSRVDCPIPTITTKGRVGLSSCVLCHGMVPPAVENPSAAMLSLLATMRELGVVDIGFRMLSNPELSAAQGFDASYIFHGTKSDVTRQIGNSVSPDQAEAITMAIAAA